MSTVRICDGVTLHCGDAYELAPTLQADVCITDPPYEITATGGGIGATRKDLADTTGFTDCGFDYALLSSFRNWACFGTLRQVPLLIEAAARRRWMLVTWNKSNPCPLVSGNYLPDTEYIIHAWTPPGGLYGTVRDKARFIVHPLGDKEVGNHPNEKPVRVMTKIIRTASDAGQTVIDPFMGSGTTGIACIRQGRRFVGIERDRRWFDEAVDRLRREVAQGQLFPPLLNGAS